MNETKIDQLLIDATVAFSKSRDWSHDLYSGSGDPCRSVISTNYLSSSICQSYEALLSAVIDYIENQFIGGGVSWER